MSELGLFQNNNFLVILNNLSLERQVSVIMVLAVAFLSGHKLQVKILRFFAIFNRCVRENRHLCLNINTKMLGVYMFIA